MIQNLLRHTVNVTRITNRKDTSGGNDPIESTAYSSLPCLVQPVTATWLMQYQRRSIDISHTVFFASNPTIINGDVIMFGSRKLLVKGFRDLQEWGRVLAVDCLEIK